MSHDAGSAASMAIATDGQLPMAQTLLSTLAVVVLTVVFFRSVLPRIPRLFLRGRLRIKRAGLRGVRGIEWQSNGFAAVRARSGSVNKNNDASGTASAGQGAAELPGLVVKIRHIYFTFHRRQGQQAATSSAHLPGDDAERRASSDSERSPNDDDDNYRQSKSTAWITLHVDGIGITLPKEDAAAKQRRAEAAQQKARDAEAARAKREEDYEERLQQLLQNDRPSSPRLGGIGRPLSPLFGRGHAPRPSMATISVAALSALQGRPPSEPEEPSTESFWESMATQRDRVARVFRFEIVPALLLMITRMMTFLASSLASLMPFITSIIDLEMHKIEVYSPDADIVFRAKRVSLGAHIDIITEPTIKRQGETTSAKSCESRACASLRERLSHRFTSIQQRLESGATGVATVVRERLPGVRVSMQVSTEGLQAFDARRARQRILEGQGDYERRDANLWLSSSVFTAPSSPPRLPSSIHAANEREWRNFSDVIEDGKQSRQGSRRPTMKRLVSSSAMTTATREGGRGARWTGSWADWTLKARPNRDFTSSTTWAQGVEGCHHNPISPSARLLAMSTLSVVRLGVGLGKAVSRESLHLAVDLAPVMLSADALGRVQERLSQANKHNDSAAAGHGHSSNNAGERLKEPKAPPKALVKILEILSSATLQLPSLKIDLSSKSSASAVLSSRGKNALQGEMPSSIQMSAELTDLFLSVKNSDVRDSDHHRWLGACGIKGYRGRRMSRALPSQLRWPRAPTKALIEHRRVYSLDCGVKQVKLLLGTDGQARSLQSTLLEANTLTGQARSSWTPAGLLLATRVPDSGQEPFFRSDPNESAIIVHTKAERVTGNLTATHLSSLLSFVASRSAQTQSNKHKPNGDGKKIGQLPRFVYHGELHDLSYCLDTSDCMSESDIFSGRRKQDIPEVSLNLSVPRILLNIQSSYSDTYVRRPDIEKRHAWTALEKGQLEWSLPSSEQTEGHPASSKGEEDISEEEEDTLRYSPAEEPLPISKPTESDDPRDAQSLSLVEAIQEMQRIQRQGKVQSKRRQLSSRRRSQDDRTGPRTNLCYKATFHSSFDACKLYWVTSKRAEGLHESMDDNGLSAPFGDTALFEKPAIPKHTELDSVISLKSLTLDLQTIMPGMQMPLSNVITLFPQKTNVQVQSHLHEFDLDLWQESSLQAISALMAALQRRNDTKARKSHNASSQSCDISEASDAEGTLFEQLSTEISVYFSVGAMSAHIGGVDKRCDERVSRGVGMDVKTAVFQFVSSATERRSITESARLAFGARSALDLPEDLRTSVASTALRQGKAASCKVELDRFGVFPLLDAQTAMDHHSARHEESEERDDSEKEGGPSSPSIIAPAVWEFQKTKPERSDRRRKHKKWKQQDRSNFMIWMPKLALQANLVAKIASPPGGQTHEEIQIVGDRIKLLSFKIELLHTYCLLVATSSMMNAFVHREKRKSPTENEEQFGEVSNGTPAHKSKGRRFKPPLINVTLDIDDIHADITLPNEVKIFILIFRFNFSFSEKGGPRIKFEWLIPAVESAEQCNAGAWEEVGRIRDCSIAFRKDTDIGRMAIDFDADGFNFRVPFGYLIYPIIDGTVVSVKATKQLLLQFLNDSNESYIIPVAEDPKHLPLLNFNIRTFAIEAQDDPFETRLNIIWRSGGDENQARAEREAAFDEKVNKLGERLRSPSQISLGSTGSATSATSAEGDAATMRDSIPLKEARHRLDMFNAASWIRRYTNAKTEQARREEAMKRRIYGRVPVTYERRTDLPIRLLPRAKAAPLFRSTMSRVKITIAPPSFPERKLRDFLHLQGSGMPKDMDYSILVPMHLNISMGEWRVELRDYPLPLLHFPPVDREKHTKDLPGVEVAFDCVIAEQLGTDEALRHIPAVIVPAATGKKDAIEYGISVPRMAMPTKFFGSPDISINSSYTSRLVWGQSIQPAISDCVRILEGITTPPQDPSPRIGFWDKLSLIFHGQVRIRFPYDGQFHLYLKGSREPYHILGHGAGWVKCWRGNVDIKINMPNNDDEIVQILSNEYILAIPELKDHIDRAATGTENQSVEESDYHRHMRETYKGKEGSQLLTLNQAYAKDPEFKKICLKLTNGVRWGSALRIERTCSGDDCQQQKKCSGRPFYRECRFWSRKKHWEVYTRSKEFVESLPENERGDSFQGWRSHHLHLSISVTSPVERENESNRNSGDSHTLSNNFFFTPLAWEHFWAWMRLFDSTLGLPIRQGRLFPGSLEQSPKFGKHLGTIKYRFDLAPLFISHVYPQDSKLDWARGRKSLLGIKAKMNIFHLDFHQRTQEIVSDRPELGGLRKRFHKPFYEAEVDLSDINFRAMAGRFSEPDKRLFPRDEYDGEDEDDDQDKIFGDEGGEIRTDFDNEWCDLQDFVELDWAPRDTGREPIIKLMEAMTCPRFNYYRRIESKRERAERTKGAPSPDEDEATLERSKFGSEDTHTCLVGTAPHPPQMQKIISQERLRVLHEELEELAANAEEDWSRAENELRQDAIRKKIKLIEGYINLLTSTERAFDHSQDQSVESESNESPPEKQSDQPHHLEQIPRYSKEVVKEWQAFDNRFFVHNPVVFYSNATRDVLLKYYLSSRKRRAIVHSLSARAVRYIKNLMKLDTSDDNEDERAGKRIYREKSRTSASEFSLDSKSAEQPAGEAPKVLRDLLEETMAQVKTKPLGSDKPAVYVGHDGPDPHEGISEDFEVNKSNICVMIKPQVVLKSLLNDTSTIIITATRARMHNYAVVDPSEDEDSVNHRALHRNYIGVDGLQAFHPTSAYCDPWRVKPQSSAVTVPLETLIDLRHTTTEFDRIAPRTDANIQYDKFNKLRLSDPNRPVYSSSNERKDPDVKKQDTESGRNDHLGHMMDIIRVHCPRYSVSANAEQFGAIYNVVTDLLLYRDPAYREHAKKLETVQLSHDFGDIMTLADIVQELQVRIRHARELHAQYHLHFSHLNEQGRLDFLSLKAEIHELQDELNLLLEAITASDDTSDKEKKLALRFDAQAEDIGWNMMGESGNDLLAKLSIRGVSFTWLNKADNSVANTLSIADMYALNVHPDALFAEIITKYHKPEDHPMRQKGLLINAMWSALAPVGGIGIVDHFELNLHPLRIQLEHRIGRKIEEYIFGSVRDKKRQQKQIEDQRRRAETIVNSTKPESTSKGGSHRKVSSQLRRLALAMRGSNKSQEQSQSLEDSEHFEALSDRPASSSGATTPQLQSSRGSMDARPPGQVTSDRQKDPSSKRPSSSLGRVNSETWPPRAGASQSTNERSSQQNDSAQGSGISTPAHEDADEESASENGSDEHAQQTIAANNAVEMRERASRTVTFVYFKLSETVLCLSYKSEKQKSITNLYDLVFRAPRLEYINRTWAHADLVTHLKKDILRAAWSQKATLLKGVINHRRPAHAQKMAAVALSLSRSRGAPIEDVVTKPFDGAMKETQDAEQHNADNELSHTSSPHFNLYVEPPSVDQREQRDLDDMGSDEEWSSHRKSSSTDFNDPSDEPGGLSVQGDQAPSQRMSEDKNASSRPTPGLSGLYEGGHGLSSQASATPSNSSSSKTVGQNTQGQHFSQGKLGRMLAKTLHFNKEARSSEETSRRRSPFQQDLEMDGHDDEEANDHTDASLPRSHIDYVPGGSADKTSPVAKSTPSSPLMPGNGTFASSENAQQSPSRHLGARKNRDRKPSGGSMGLDSMLVGVRRARDRLGSAPSNGDAE